MGRSRVLRLATRGSPLALRQTRLVADLVCASGDFSCEPVVVGTKGDRLSEAPIEQIGGQGAFVKEVSAAVLEGRADVAVHSAKDLTPVCEAGLVIAAVPLRADPRDALVGSRLEDLCPGATVATGSVRRRAQLAWLRPDLTFCDLRGNLQTRIDRSRSVGAGVVAAAALERMGLSDQAAELLDTDLLLPQVGQGAIAVECRVSDEEVIGIVSQVDDPRARAQLLAERAFLAELGSGCSLPCGALATPAADDRDGEDLLALEAMMASRDGHVVLRRREIGDDPQALGKRLANCLLDDAGGRSLADWELR